MGSKSPDGRENGHHGNPTESVQSNRVGGEPRGSHMSRDGDGCLGDGGDEDGDGDGDGDGDRGEVSLRSHVPHPSGDKSDLETTTKKPKKKKKRSKKGKNVAKSPIEQTSPPRIPLNDLYPTNDYPKGERQEYTNLVDESTRNSSAAEIRYNARLLQRDDNFLSNYRKAGEIHRQARQWVQQTVQPGQTLASIADSIEDTVRALMGNSGLETGDCLKSGMGFPTGICLNHEVAHYTPNPGQKDVILQQQDVMTIDFGVHINGWIVDSAFTMAFDPMYDNLLAAVKDATNTGIKNAGIDVRISDVSAAIQEAMESYEVEIRGRTYPVKAIRNLCGHNITQYHIHGGKSIPFVKNADQTKMEAGEVFAIETFGSTGRGWVHDDVGVYGYSLEQDAPLRTPISLSSARRLHKTIRENFGTLPFSRRYLERLGVEKYLAGMNTLVSSGIVEQYRPLTEVKGSYAAQFEHTLILHETHKEILSRGNDY